METGDRRFLSTRIVSSLEKGLLTDRVEDFPVLALLTALKGERINFQLFMRTDKTTSRSTRQFEISLSGEYSGAVIREVRQVYADMPTYAGDPSESEGLLINSPTGLYPDILIPLDRDRYIRPREETLTSVWFEVTFADAGKRDLCVNVLENGEIIARERLSVEVIGADLPEQKLIFTQWFHNDCLASYYNVPVFSEEHWRIVENFMRCASYHGMNCILVPVLTPPLDTAAGTERPTVQLVGVSVNSGVYSFDFTLLKRYLDLARSCGFKYFEISHLFTQWGAVAAPKVMASVDGEYRRIFGWDTPSTEGEYPRFLSFFLPALVGYLRSEGILENCRFHLSDEPGEDHIESYAKVRAAAVPYLDGCVIIDAASSLELFRKGIINTPIPGINRVDAFLDEDISERWTYYCCGQWDKVTNRFIAHPAFRNRIIGVQLYKFGIAGFLQWGYNFYYSMLSRRLINPYLVTSGEGQVPSGDPFSVYPGACGEPLPSPRMKVFHEALQDISALNLCESIIGRKETISLIDRVAGMDLTFKSYPKSASFLLDLRREVNSVIALRQSRKA